MDKKFLKKLRKLTGDAEFTLDEFSCLKADKFLFLGKYLLVPSILVDQYDEDAYYAPGVGCITPLGIGFTWNLKQINKFELLEAAACTVYEKRNNALPAYVVLHDASAPDFYCLKWGVDADPAA